MFGKGIYFADMVSKSANYCYANSTRPEGLALLCEVCHDEVEGEGNSKVEEVGEGR